MLKFLHTAVEPHLYRSLKAVHEHDLLYFLRSILLCPRLTQHVKILEARDPRENEHELSPKYDPRALRQYYFPTWIKEPTSLFADPNAFCDNELEAAVRRIIWRARLPADMAYDWYLNFEQFKWGAAAALVLLSLPNLQHVCLGMRQKGAWGYPRFLREFERLSTTGRPGENHENR